MLCTKIRVYRFGEPQNCLNPLPAIWLERISDPDYKVMRVEETGAVITSTPVKERIIRMVLLSTLIWDFLAVDL